MSDFNPRLAALSLDRQVWDLEIKVVPFEFGFMGILRLELLQFFRIHLEAYEEFLKKKTGSRITLLSQG